MKSCRSSLALGVALLMSLLSSRAEAATPRIPSSMYPAGAHIRYVHSLSNEQMDCMWSFFCEGGVPVFHFRSQTELHRAGGWAQFAGWHNNAMTFDLFVSDYDTAIDDGGIPWSARAFADLASALRGNGYRRFGFPGGILPHGDQGAVLVEIQHNGPRDIVVAACWSRTTEIEALVMFNHRSSIARQTALADLRRQLLAANRGVSRAHAER